jgi:hypothetical protein
MPAAFFEHQPALGGLGGDDRGDAALADQGRRMRAGRGVGEDQRDVLGAHVAAVDAVGAARAALDPADDFEFLAIRAFGEEHDLGEVARRALAVPAKITSSMPPPRIDLAELSPMTQRIASSRLDLPQPLGPTTPVSPGSMRSSAGSTKLLKPLSLSRLMRIPACYPRAAGLELGLELFPLVRLELVAIDHQRRRRIDTGLARVLGLLGDGFGRGGVGEAGLGLVECNAALGEEVGQP